VTTKEAFKRSDDVIKVTKSRGPYYTTLGPMREVTERMRNMPTKSPRWRGDDGILEVEGPTPDLDQAFLLASTDPGGFRDLLAAECTHLLERRGRDFEDYMVHASMLEGMVRTLAIFGSLSRQRYPC
jgi:hypothetical protein